MTLTITRYCRIRMQGDQTDQLVVKTVDNEFLVSNDPARLYQESGMEYPKYFKMDQVSKYGILAAEWMFKGSDFRTKYSENELAIVLSDAFGSLDTDIEFQKTIQSAGHFFPSPAIFVYTLSNIVMGELCIRYKMKGENMFFVSDTFNAGLLSDYVQALFENTHTKATLTGWVDYINGQPEILLMFVEKQSEKPGFMEFNTQNIELLYT